MSAVSTDEEKALLKYNSLLDGEEPHEPEASVPCLAQEMWTQAKLAGPIAIGHITNMALSLISLAFVGHLDTRYLAAAALGTTLYNMSAKILLAGMLGALDTYSSQAVGARNFDALGSMFKQGVLFLMLHTIPVAIVFMSLPTFLKRLGQPEDLTTLLRPYLMALLPGVWIDAIYRPFNRILIAQHISQPQMWISCAVALQHAPVTYLFIHTFKQGYIGAAYSTVWSSLLAMLLVAAYVRWSNLQSRVWATPNGVVFQPWGPFIKLSYASCAMRAIELWSLNICTVAAGWLPDASMALSAMAVASSIYGVAYMAFCSMMMAACTRVGNGLGAGSAKLAKLSAQAAAATVPALWVLLAGVLVVPVSQQAVIRVFTSESDPAMLRHMRHLLNLLAVLMFFDGGQFVLSGVAAGAGKQTKGFAINTFAHWGLALPTAILLGFHFHLGVEGLYSGVVLGPVAQWSCYLVLVLRLNWDKEAQEAHANMLRVVESMAALTFEDTG